MQSALSFLPQCPTGIKSTGTPCDHRTRAADLPAQTQRHFGGSVASAAANRSASRSGTALREIRALGYAIKVDTNGCFPQQLAKLIDLDLVDYIAMDIKNSPTQYAATVGLADFDLKPVQESIDILQNGAVPFEFRTTVVRGLHDENSFHQLGQWLAGAPHYYLQQFVDSGNLLGETEGGFTPDEMANFLAIIRSYIPMAELRGIDI